MTMAISDELMNLDRKAVIKVCGVGGGGGNAVARMVEENLQEVEFIAINTDAQALINSKAGNVIQIGKGGLGAGAKPDKGREAAETSKEDIARALEDADMIFLTAGLGGGTGTGAAPVVAEIARESGALTVAIVTLPFTFENRVRMTNALRGLSELEKHVDALIVIPNDRLNLMCKEDTSLLGAFRMADEVLYNGVRAISELITVPGLINLDFADVETTMKESGRALMGIGLAEGDGRAIRAAEEAIVCPLLEKSSIDGALGVIVNVKGGCDITMREVYEAVTIVKRAAHPSANIIFGAVLEEEEQDEIQVTVIAAGFVAEPRKAQPETDGKNEAPAGAENGDAKPDKVDAIIGETRKPGEEAPKPADSRDIPLPHIMHRRRPQPVRPKANAPEKKPVPAEPPKAEQGDLFSDSGKNGKKDSRNEAERDKRIPAFMRKRMQEQQKQE